MPKRVREIQTVGDCAYITLSQGFTAVIDANDAMKVAGRNWHAAPDKYKDGLIRSVYARSAKHSGASTVILHRYLMDAPAGYEVDHIDGDGLNNRRSNLRIVKKAQNAKNRKQVRKNFSGVKGVYWCNRSKKWRASISADCSVINLGSYERLEDAAAAYAAASEKFHGEFGRIA